MYVIIMGGGQIGASLALKLSQQNHEVLVIEQNENAIEWLQRVIGEDSVLLGDGCEALIQERAGMVRADIFIAATNEDEDNLIACQVAKAKYDVRTTISRVHNPKQQEIFTLMGVDHIISDVDAILQHIEDHISHSPLKTLMEVPEIGVEVVRIVIPSNSHPVNQLVKDVELPESASLLAIYRGNLPVIKPNVETFFMEKDQVVVSVKTSEKEALVRALTY